MGEKKFEEAMEKLEKIVESLESGDLSLEDSIKAFEEGMKLAKFCSEKLEEAEKKVTMLVEENGGKYIQTSFKIEDESDSRETP